MGTQQSMRKEPEKASLLAGTDGWKRCSSDCSASVSLSIQTTRANSVRLSTCSFSNAAPQKAYGPPLMCSV